MQRRWGKLIAAVLLLLALAATGHAERAGAQAHAPPPATPALADLFVTPAEMPGYQRLDPVRLTDAGFGAIDAARVTYVSTDIAAQTERVMTLMVFAFSRPTEADAMMTAFKANDIFCAVRPCHFSGCGAPAEYPFVEEMQYTIVRPDVSPPQLIYTFLWRRESLVWALQFVVTFQAGAVNQTTCRLGFEALRVLDRQEERTRFVRSFAPAPPVAAPVFLPPAEP